jgi:WD40 repeat protein
MQPIVIYEPDFITAHPPHQTTKSRRQSLHQQTNRDNSFIQEKKDKLVVRNDKTLKCVHKISSVHETNRVQKLIFLEENSHFITYSQGSFIILWGTGSTRPLKRLVFQSIKSHITCVTKLNNGLLAIAGTNKSIKIYNVYAQHPEKVFNSNDTQWSLIELPGGKLASGSGQGMVRLWDMNSRKTEEHEPVFSHQNEGKFLIYRVIFVKSTNEIAYTNYNNILTMHIEDYQKAPNRMFSGHMFSINDIAYVSGLSRLVSGSDDKSIKIWDFATTRCLVTIHGHEHFVRNITHINEDEIFSGGFDSYLRSWDTETGECTATVKTSWKHILQTVKYQDNAMFCCGSDRNIRLYAF